MNISSRTPEGEPNRCPVCGHAFRLEPSRPPGDAPCPNCGSLLWFAAHTVRAKSRQTPIPDLPEMVTAWDFGVEKVRRGDAAGGLAVLQNVVTHAPQDVAKRRALRELERQLHQEHRLDPSMDDVTLVEVWLEIESAKRGRTGTCIEWDAIDRAAERGLAIDPSETALHRELGRACEARGYREAAQFAYACALELTPEDAEIRECLAKLGK